MQKEDRGNRMFWVLVTLAVVTSLPPVHEGLHGVACELQGGRAEIGLLETKCFTDNPMSFHERELFLSLPFVVPMFFVGIVYGFGMNIAKRE